MMKKGTKFAALLLSLALIIPACQKKQPVAPSSDTDSQSESQSQSEQVNYTVSISNKQALQAPDWHAKGDSRKVEIEVEPKANVAQLVREGVIQITSSDTEKLNITGQMANPVAEGQATITVTCGQSTDSVEVTIAEEEVAEVVNYGTEQQPLTISQVLTEVAKEKLENKSYSAQYFFARATLKTAVAAGKFTLTDGTKDMEVSSAVLEEGKQATDYKIDDIILLRAYVRADSGKPNGYYFSYNQGASGNNAPTIIGWEDGGGTPITVETHEVTVAEALTVGNALQDNETTTDLYIVTGFITSVKYHWSEAHPTVTFNIGDTADAAAASQLNIYSAACTQELDAKILAGAKISVKGNIQKYVSNGNTTIELVGGTELTVITEAPTVNTYEVTVGGAITAVNALEDNATTADWYKVTGYVVQVTYAFANGTMSFTMGDTADATALLTCFKTATTEAIAAKVLAGAKITVTGNLQKYIKNNAVVPELVNGKDIVIVSEAGGGDTPVDPPVEENNLSLTAATLDLNVTSYAANNGDHTVGGVTFNTTAIMKRSGDGNTSMQWQKANAVLLNTTALGKKIDNVVVTYQVMGYSDNEVTFEFGAAALSSGTAAETKKLTTVKDTLEYTITPTAKTYEFLKISNPTGGAHYIESVVINFVEEEQPQQTVLPVGNFSGHATTAAGNIFTMIALGSEAAYVEVAIPGSPVKLTTTYTYAAATNTVTITAEGLGTITAVYDETDNALKQVTLSDNAIASMISDNGQIVLSGAKYFWNCDGTTAELKNVFNRREQSSGWVTNDTTNATLEAADGIAGQGVKVGANTSYAVSLVLKNQMPADVEATSNIGFWVYNSGAANVTIRQWMFIGADLNNGKEQGSVTAVAGQWTYVRMGFASGNDPISYQVRNFSIADFQKSGTALVYDNIALF